MCIKIDRILNIFVQINPFSGEANDCNLPVEIVLRAFRVPFALDGDALFRVHVPSLCLFLSHDQLSLFPANGFQLVPAQMKLNSVFI